VFDGKFDGPRSRDRLIKDLSERLQAVTDSGDPTGVLDAATLHLAQDLAETIPQDPQDAVVPGRHRSLGVLVAVHWARYQFLPKGRTKKICRPA